MVYVALQVLLCLFRHLKVGQIECRKRRILVGRVKLYISALQIENGELLLVVSPQFNANGFCEICRVQRKILLLNILNYIVITLCVIK